MKFFHFWFKILPMDKMALVLIVLTLLLLAVIVGVLTLLIYKMIKTQGAQVNPVPSADPQAAKEADVSKSEFHPAILERMKDMEKLKPKRADLFCPNHSEEPGETVCAICDRLFCRSCIKPFKTMHFCKEHLPLIMKHDWDEVLTLKTSTQDPEQGVRLFDAKKDIFQNEDIPTYVETHYKINVDQDYIETYLVLYAQKESIEIIREKFLTKINSL
jgi:hypothetical protein